MSGLLAPSGTKSKDSGCFNETSPRPSHAYKLSRLVGRSAKGAGPGQMGSIDWTTGGPGLHPDSPSWLLAPQPEPKCARGLRLVQTDLDRAFNTAERLTHGNRFKRAERRRHPDPETSSAAMGDNVDTPDAEAPFPLTDVDKWVLAQTDAEFRKHDWNDLKQTVETNQLSVLKRTPSELRRYMSWTAATKAQYGSITEYLLANRLPQSWGQPPFAPDSPVPFAEASDYKVLLNDWPYGLEPNITHLVVWTRTPIATDDREGDMTPESRALVADFVTRYFVHGIGEGGEQRVLWFKNWVALQSVRALDHIHVLVKDVDDETLERWTGTKPTRGQ